jgi:hypothetical protein
MTAGNLNFIFTSDDRLSFGGIASSPADSDAACMREWNQLFSDSGFKEIDQPGFTCRHSFGYSKIDKCFDNMHAAESEMLQVGCNTVVHPSGLSDHHPLSVWIRYRSNTGSNKIPQWVTREADFPDEVFGFLGSNVIPLLAIR